jgi:hypothetical protein
VRGATYRSSADASSGAGSAFRSTLPLGVSGSASRYTYAAGTMCSGSRSRSRSRRSRVRADGVLHPRAGAASAAGSTAAASGRTA